MAQINIVYGSTTGNTEAIAQRLAEHFSTHQVKVISVAKAGIQDFTNCDLLLIGTSTWGMGELQDDWLGFEGKISSLPLSGKKVAFFGLGDQDGYAETFVDGMGILFSQFRDLGIKHLGAWKVEGISYDFSKAELQKGELVGLALDEDTQSAKTADRLKNWASQLLNELDA